MNLPQTPNYIQLPYELNNYDLFTRIEQHFDTCFLLESLGDHTYDSRYVIIGFQPETTFHADLDHLYINGKRHKSDNPYYELRNHIPTGNLSRSYAGGLVGYLSYEAAMLFEPSLKLKVHPNFPLFMFGLYTDGIIHDTLTGETKYFYYLNNRIDHINDLLNQKSPKLKAPTIQSKGHTTTKAQHAKAVNTVKQHIIIGNTFQCEVGFKTEYQIRGPKLPIYTKLRQVNPSPHMSYLKFQDKVIISASPELLYRQRQGEIETFPLAGTRHRGQTPDQDRQLARDLLTDPKEIAEHNMLVDLHRNDVGRVARFGTVKVRRLMDIKRFSHVQHISSEIVGIIRSELDMFDGLAAVFPAGTLSGAPKIESMKIIDSNEPQARGPYGGAIGHFGFNADATFAIPIRTLFCAGDYAYAQTSGGIVHDSQPEAEYQEILNKLAAMDKTLKYFQ